MNGNLLYAETMFPVRAAMQVLICFLPAAMTIYSQPARVMPRQIIQGEVIRVSADGDAASARLNGKVVPLFAEAGGRHTGLMPVPVLTKPGLYTLELLDGKGAPKESFAITVKDARYRRENISIAPAISTLKPSTGEQESVGEFRRTVSEIRYWKEPFTAPVPGCLTSPFGSMRMHNGKPTGDFHAGVDQRGGAGTPIHPVADGVIKLVKQYNLRGGTVAVDHGQGVETIYLHMSAFAAREGQQVTTSDVIGYIGSTGRSTGPHVHWTLYVNGEAMNPAQWMRLANCPVARRVSKQRSPSLPLKP